MSEKKFHHTVASKGTLIGVWTNASISHPTLARIFNMMRKGGWEVQNDKSVAPLIAKDYFVGKKGELQFKAHRYPAGFKIEFYQEVNTKNRNGGCYDFDKLKMMPYLIRCQFLLEHKYIKDVLLKEGYIDTSSKSYKYAYDNVMYRIKSCIHYVPGKELPSFEVETYNGNDKDGKKIRNAEIKYFRDHKGRLKCGTVYYNLNNMWWVILNKYEFTSLPSFELFDADTEENRVRKLVKPSGHHNPKSRAVPSVEQIDDWRRKAKQADKTHRIKKANEILNYLYSINWTSRHFQFFLKESGRIGLLETESKAWGIHKKFEEPKKLALYARSLPMSSTESSWVKGLRKYVVHGEPGITQWFCTDQNGEGATAYKWPEVREKLWKIGALVS